MKKKHSNKNTKITDDKIILLDSQFKTIDIQIQILRDSKDKMLKDFNI